MYYVFIPLRLLMSGVVPFCCDVILLPKIRL